MLHTTLHGRRYTETITRGSTLYYLNFKRVVCGLQTECVWVDNTHETTLGNHPLARWGPHVAYPMTVSLFATHHIPGVAYAHRNSPDTPGIQLYYRLIVLHSFVLIVLWHHMEEGGKFDLHLCIYSGVRLYGFTILSYCPSCNNYKWATKAKQVQTYKSMTPTTQHFFSTEKHELWDSN